MTLLTFSSEKFGLPQTLPVNILSIYSGSVPKQVFMPSFLPISVTKKDKDPEVSIFASCSCCSNSSSVRLSVNLSEMSVVKLLISSFISLKWTPVRGLKRNSE